MDKCEWKDGVFYPCDKFALYVDQTSLMRDGVYCAGCDTDISKPEPGVVIKKSGETQVKREDGTDYIDISGSNDLIVWAEIAPLNITDELAKLRPMVVDVGGLEKLYGVVSDEYALTDTGVYCISNYRLATVEDL